VKKKYIKGKTSGKGTREEKRKDRSPNKRPPENTERTMESPKRTNH
jgi:hypothetical protein